MSKSLEYMSYGPFTLKTVNILYNPIWPQNDLLGMTYSKSSKCILQAGGGSLKEVLRLKNLHQLNCEMKCFCQIYSFVVISVRKHGL